MRGVDLGRGSRWLGLLLVLGLMALVAAGCGGDDEQSASGGGDASACADGDATGVTDDEIVVGNTTILTGQIGFIGKEANPVFDAVVEEFNEAGGVDGRTVKVVSYDDAYNPSKAIPATRRLIEQDKIFAWAGGVGTPNFVAVLPLLERAGIPAITPYAPAKDVGTMKHPLVFMTWANFIDEYDSIASYLIENEGMGEASGDVAFVHYDTDAGRDALEGTQKAMEAAGLELKDVISVSTEESDWASVAVDLRASGADWVGMQVAAPAGGQLVQAMDDLGYNPGAFGQSDFVDEAWVKDFGDVADGKFWAAMKVKPFDDPDVAPTVEEIEAITGKPITIWNAVGYVQAKLLVAALEGMEAPTRECLEESLQSIRDLDVGLLPPISFGADVRQSVTGTGVVQLEGGEFKAVAPFE
jgi:branched-chain amino acid transport system substrate-binding protein